jgi:transposase
MGVVQMTIENKKRGRKPSVKPSAAEINRLYKKMTAKEMAEHYGVSIHTVKNWIHFYRRAENTGVK